MIITAGIYALTLLIPARIRITTNIPRTAFCALVIHDHQASQNA
jgi:hypothetical protein